MPTGTPDPATPAVTVTAPRASTGTDAPTIGVSVACTAPTAGVTNCGAHAALLRCPVKVAGLRARSAWRAATIKGAVGPRPMTDESDLPTTAPRRNSIGISVTVTAPIATVSSP